MLTYAEQFLKQYNRSTIPYASFDVRFAGFKTAHVDANFFPAGFNNISDNALLLAAQYIQATIGDVKYVGIYPEKVTRNQFYFANINKLISIMQMAGYIPIVVSEENLCNQHVRIEKLTRKGDVLYANNQIIQVLLLNNDLSDGVPEILRNSSTKILPSLELGWHKRRKSHHFKLYYDLLLKFKNHLKQYDTDFDPWLVSCYYDYIDDLDFADTNSIDKLASKASNVLTSIKAKYQEYDIKQTPHLYIKSDFGTYGMSIMTISDPDELYHINKKVRNKMMVGKSGRVNDKLILQEAVPTIQLSESNGAKHAAETMVYTVAGQIVEAFLRANDNKDHLSNLNSKGMYFVNNLNLVDTTLSFIIQFALSAMVLEMKQYG